jgi:NAD-dependent dihydropyrimidine dehydrogenase PreA subunit
MQVITIADKQTPAHIEDKGCIRCYCCHEMCPHDSIELRSGLLYRLFNRGS